MIGGEGVDILPPYDLRYDNRVVAWR